MITAVKESVFLYSIRVSLSSVYFADFVGLQLKESFQHYMTSKAASEKIEIPGHEVLKLFSCST